MALHLVCSGKISLDLLAKSLSEKALLNLLAEDLDDSFVLLVLKYQAAVLHTAQYMRLCYDDVQDVQQQTFYNAYFAMKQYSGDDIRSIWSLQDWLCMIAKHAALNLLNGKQRSISFEQASGVGEQEDSVLNEPEGRAIDTEDLRTLYEYIDLLPKKYGDLLKALAVYDVSLSELAQMLGIPVGTVKSRVAKARKLLHQVLSEEQAKREGK